MRESADWPIMGEMSLAAQIIDQQVSGIVERQSDPFDHELRLGNDEPRRRSIAFLFLVAKTAFDLTDEQTIDGIVDGGNDFGIDALYFEPPDDSELDITLIQGKYKTDLSGTSTFPENGIAGMIDAIGALFDPVRPLRLNKRLNERIEDVRSFVRDGAIPRVTAIAANNGMRWNAQAQQRIDNAAQDFGDQVEWRHIGAEEILALLQARKPINTALQLNGAATVETFDYRRALTGRMSVSELARLTDEFDNRLFEKNIRRYLGLAGNRVNEAVAETLRVANQRPNFYFYNNGITITCSQFRYNNLQRESWRVHVSDLQIVNGGQTARTVQQMAREVGPGIVDAEVLAVWREKPHQARFSSRQHFGALYRKIFTSDLNGAQAVVAALLHRQAENHRKRPPDNAPDFLAYGSRFIAMLMGRYLLHEMRISLERLDHRSFRDARDLVHQKAHDYLARAEAQIGEALDPLFRGRERTLQRLSATFRRADLVEMLVDGGA